ncbi:MAG: SH3 domain-containing protein [Leptolyngbya sp. SIO1D8]|nr:SH3 domain-containing protein [Leptolyngbya sp. SIO1D8]
MPKFYSLNRIVVISCLVALLGFGCRQTPETTSPADVDSTVESPTDEPDTGTAEAEISQTVSEEDEIASSSSSDTLPSTPSTDASETDAANPSEEFPEQSCSASAFVADTDPAGLNVRSGPGSDFSVVDTLPTDGPVEVTISGAAYGWLKLATAWSMERQELEAEGWVYAPLLGVTTRSDTANSEAPVPLFATPDAAANVRAELPKFTEVSLLTCSGNWLQVESGDASGWLATDNQCSSPVATCP